jgi:hypothetical protein
MKQKRKMSAFARIQAWLSRERRKQARAREKGEPYQGFVLAKHVDPADLKRPLNLSRVRVPVKRAHRRGKHA